MNLKRIRLEEYTSFLNEILKYFSENSLEYLSDDDIKKSLSEIFDDEIKKYLNYYDSFKPHINDKYKNKIKKLIVIRIFASNIWDEIHNNYDHARYDDRKYRISALGKILYRVLLIADENLVLFRNGMGISILSNSRMMLESYAFAMYIYKAGEVEADRFQDYAKVQAMQIRDSKNKKLIFGDKYSDDFYKQNGWISDQDSRSISKIMSKLEDENYIKYYKLLSNYVHASPYSIYSVMSLGKPEKTMEEHHFPLSFNDTLEINIKVIYDYVKLVINCFLLDGRESYIIALQAIVALI